MTGEPILASSTRRIHAFPSGENIIGMAEHNGTVLVTTNRGVYRLDQSAGTVVQVFGMPQRKPWFTFRGFWARVWGRA